MNKTMNIFDILNSISFTKEDLSDRDEFNKEFNPFMINRFLSMSPDTIFYAELMNRNYQINNKNMYKILMNLIPKKKRYFKYEKGESSDEMITVVMKYFNVNQNVANQYVQILNENEKKQIKDLVKEIQ